MGPTSNDSTGHTEWPDGAVHHTGFTTVMTPNTKVLVTYNGQVFDADVNTRREGSSATVPTYAAITARSYHSSVVNVALMDGSVRSVRDSISLVTWRALGNDSQATPFLGAIGLFVLSYIGIAISLYPMIVPHHFTLWQAASSGHTQAFLLVGTLVLLPVILMYTGWSYWVFRGKVRADVGYH